MKNMTLTPGSILTSNNEANKNRAEIIQIALRDPVFGSPEFNVDKIYQDPTGFPGTGSIPFNELPQQTSIAPITEEKLVDSSLIKKDEWISFVGNTAINAVEATGKVASLGVKEITGAFMGIAKDIFVSEKPKELVKPEDQEKKMKESLVYRQSIETFKREEARIPQQEYNEMVKMALRMGVNVETLADKLQAPHLKKEELLKTYYIALGETVENAEKKAAEQAEKQQNMVETSKRGNSNKMRLDAQEGNSMVANQITSAG